MRNNLCNAWKKLLENKEIIFAFLIVLVLVFSFFWIWDFIGLPNKDALVEIVKKYFHQYGLPVIFVSAILESILLIGNYFPGSLVIFLAVSLTSGNPELAIKTILVVCAGMIIGYNINYFVGKFGFYKLVEKFGFKKDIEILSKKIDKKGELAGTFMYVVPAMGSLISTTFGVVRFNYFRFLIFTILVSSFWNSVWGVLVYIFGMPLFNLLTSYISIFIILVLYFIYMYKSGKLDELKSNN